MRRHLEHFSPFLARTVGVGFLSAGALAGFNSTVLASPVDYFSVLTNVYFGTVTEGSSSTNIVEIESDTLASLPNASVAEHLGASVAVQLSLDPQATQGIIYSLQNGLPIGADTPIPQFVLATISDAPSQYILGLNGNSGPPDPAVTAFNNTLAQAGLTISASFTNFDPEAVFTYQVDDETDEVDILDNIQFYELTTTPLPSTWTMMLIGLIGLGVVDHRRCKNTAFLGAA
jgi:hypothetical protein